MNTTVKYKRPSHRNKYGQYKSVTPLASGFIGHIKIFLVWFNGLGWYYSVELQGWSLDPAAVPQYMNQLHATSILDYSKDKAMWKNGKDLPLCAYAAETEATKMLEAHGINGLEFSPFVLSRN